MLIPRTLQDQHFVIYELRYDCRYVVRVMPISDHGAIGEETRMTFVTPSCGEVEVVGRVQPDCPISGQYVKLQVVYRANSTILLVKYCTIIM